MLKGFKYRVLVGVLSGLYAQVTMAGSQGNTLKSASNFSETMVISLCAGPSWARAGSTQTLVLEPEIENTYAANKNTNALATGSLFIGLQRPFNAWILGQFGFAIGASGNAKLYGDIWENADANFNDYFYSYKVNTGSIGVKGKLLAQLDSWSVQPYISGSAGIAVNRSYAYISTPKIPENAPTPGFIEQRKSSLSYILGAGIQKQWSEHWSAGVGYEFADWGQSTLGPTSEQTMNGGLSLSNLYTHSLMFNLTYMA
ncbi:outer membrane protein [Legionella bononiensis]|uniref:Porin family protein n=1 Tax=Legionella bononiensis TaxID=2793102 RepID=A0ABS1WD83_9GAMM|nr:porin family protein [Legionella bononiensis]MBL7481201.1 porin family protein [Legionella bononiensis]MBL7527307.1 porin family protein [Legionella bononiensis]MBL7562276.1 porin family protein [Legionella bononiensis]